MGYGGAAQAGHERAFAALARPFEREIHVHCYRMLGALDDADDALQEALLRAWRGLARFEPRAPLRAWLYRIATNVCLTMLAARQRRGEVPATALTVAHSEEDEAMRLGPYPDRPRDELGPGVPGPESSGAITASLGYKDNNSMPVDDAFGAVARIARNVSIPVTADLEADYHLSPTEFVARLLDAGAVGCNIEDADHDAAPLDM